MATAAVQPYSLPSCGPYEPSSKTKKDVTNNHAYIAYMQSLVQAFSEASIYNGKKTINSIISSTKNNTPNSTVKETTIKRPRILHRHRRVSEPLMSSFVNINDNVPRERAASVSTGKPNVSHSKTQKPVSPKPFTTEDYHRRSSFHDSLNVTVEIVREQEPTQNRGDENDDTMRWATKILEGELHEPMKILFNTYEPSPAIPPLDFRKRWSFTESTLEALTVIIAKSSAASSPSGEENKNFTYDFEKSLPNPKNMNQLKRSTVSGSETFKRHLSRIPAPVRRHVSMADNPSGTWSYPYPDRSKPKKRRPTMSVFANVQEDAELSFSPTEKHVQQDNIHKDIPKNSSDNSQSQSQNRVGRSISLEGRKDTKNDLDTKVRRSWSNVDVRSLGKMIKRATSDVYKRQSHKDKSSSMFKNALGNSLMFNKGSSKDIIQWTPDMNTPEQIRAQQVRRFIVQELFTTEQTYFKDLNIVKNMFMNPFIAAASTPTPLVDPNDISIIFSFITELIDISRQMVSKLYQVIQTWKESETYVGDIFVQYEEAFDVYIRYAVNWNAAHKAIKKANNNILYRRFIQESLLKNETNRLGLSDYMIIPIQRITRYCLLLRDLKVHTSPNHPDYKNINKALTNICIVAMAMNNVQNFK